MEDKTYFAPGEVVELKQDIPMKPIMIVKTVDKANGPDGKSSLIGVTCFWFTTTFEYQSHRFNTKDLNHYE